MTTIFAKVVCDSINPSGQRLTTLHCRYPLVVHAEVLTHRVFSRNARSSRAVPIKTMIQECVDDPFVPLHWGAARPGMQATEECDNPLGFEEVDRKDAWLCACDAAVRYARSFMVAGYHKQVVNRLLAPFLHIDTLITATEWQNFFALRDHPDAEPHIAILARAVKQAMAESSPQFLSPVQWHLPYVDVQERGRIWDDGGYESNAPSDVSAFHTLLRKLSVARCARISYAPFDGDASIAAELKRYDLLVGSDPLHASPAEHQATPDTYIDDNALVKQWRHPNLQRNFVGWQQYRAMIDG